MNCADCGIVHNSYGCVALISTLVYVSVQLSATKDKIILYYSHDGEIVIAVLGG